MDTWSLHQENVLFGPSKIHEILQIKWQTSNITIDCYLTLQIILAKQGIPR